MKTCSRCKEEKTVDCFGKIKSSNDGYRYECNECRRIDSKKYYDNNKAKIAAYAKEYQKSNKDKLFTYRKEYRLKNKDKISQRNAEYTKKNKIRRAEYARKYDIENRQKTNDRKKRYYHDNKDKIREKANRYTRDRKKTDIHFKITHLLRKRVWNAIKNTKGASKKTSTYNLIGCTVPEYKEHIQSLFTSGMSWDNHGKGSDCWHIDHIIPCAAFDLTDESEQKLCFHYSNTQPLWETENLRKHSKVI